ncbi:hypothetical protein HN51_032320, partial [Arachis hypogaea]
ARKRFIRMYFYLVDYTKQSYHNKNVIKAQLITQYRVSFLVVKAVIVEIETANT